MSFLASCKKEHLTPENSSSSPVFYFKGTVGNTAMNMQAGINNYYMYSSYTQDSHGVYNYTGNLKEYNCSSNCPPSIEFIINNYRTLASGAGESNISTSFKPGYFNYLIPGGAPDSLIMTFTPSQNTTDTIKSYTWNFGDGTIKTITGSQMFPVSHVYTHAGVYNTSLSVLFGNNTSSTLINPVQMGDTVPSLNCSISIISDTSFMANIYGGSGSYSYQWNFGDSANPSLNTSTGSSPNHNYTDNLVHTVTLILTDNVTKNSTTVYSLAANSSGGIVNSKVFNYKTSAPVLIPDSSELSNITIRYTDATGDIYTSNNPAQPDSSYFQITSMSDYQANENGQSTKQLHIKFDCIVFDSKGNTLAIKNGDAVIAVAYK